MELKTQQGPDIQTVQYSLTTTIIDYGNKATLVQRMSNAVKLTCIASGIEFEKKMAPTGSVGLKVVAKHLTECCNVTNTLY